MGVKIANNVWGRLAASITDSDTTITLLDASLFPALPEVDDYSYATLVNTSNQLEIVKVTAVDTGANTLTVERGAEGTTPRPYTGSDLIELRVTAQTVYDLFLQNSTDAAASAAAAEQAAADAQQIADDFGDLASAIQQAEDARDAAAASASAASDSADDAEAAQAAAEAARDEVFGLVPDPQPGDAGKLLEVNPAETGYQLVEVAASAGGEYVGTIQHDRSLVANLSGERPLSICVHNQREFTASIVGGRLQRFEYNETANGNQWAAIGPQHDPGGDGTAGNATAMTNTRLAVGCGSTLRAVRWNPGSTSWTDLGGDYGLVGPIYDVAAIDNNNVAVHFQGPLGAGGNPSIQMYNWDGAAWSPVHVSETAVLVQGNLHAVSPTDFLLIPTALSSQIRRIKWNPAAVPPTTQYWETVETSFYTPRPGMGIRDSVALDANTVIIAYTSGAPGIDPSELQLLKYENGAWVEKLVWEEPPYGMNAIGLLNGVTIVTSSAFFDSNNGVLRTTQLLCGQTYPFELSFIGDSI